MKTKIALIFGILLLSFMAVTYAQTENLEAFATMCSGDTKEIAMSFGPQEVQTAVKAYEIGGCITTYGATCVASIAEGQIKAAATQQLLNSLVTAVPQIGPAITTYNAVNGFISTGSKIQKGCLKMDKSGTIYEMDPIDISADKKGNAQDISNIFYGNNAKLNDNQRIFGKNIKLSNKDKNFLIDANNSLVKINGKEANLASGNIKISRIQDNKGNITGTNVESADIVIGKGGGTLKFGNYEGTFKEGTKVLFNSTTGFSFPAGQAGKSFFMSSNGINSSILLGNSSASVKLVNGKYKIEDNNFEVDGMKVYSDKGLASLTINEKNNWYIKGKNTVVETKGIRIGGDESNLISWSTNVTDYSKNYVVVSEVMNTVNIYSGKRSEIDIEFLKGNPFINTNGTVKLTTRDGALTLVQISKSPDGPLGIIVDSMSGITIQNAQGETILKDGKLYGQRAYNIYSESIVRIAEDSKNGIVTPMTISVVPHEKIETPKGTILELKNVAPNYILKVIDSDDLGLSTCSNKQMAPAPPKSFLSEVKRFITGYASAGLVESCTIWFNANLRGKNTFIQEGDKTKIYDSTKQKYVELISSAKKGEYVGIKDQTLDTGATYKPVYDKDANEIGMQLKDSEGKYGSVQYYNIQTTQEAPAAQKPIKASLERFVGLKSSNTIDLELRTAVIINQLSPEDENLIRKVINNEELTQEQVTKLKSGKIAEWMKDKYTLSFKN